MRKGTGVILSDSEAGLLAHRGRFNMIKHQVRGDLLQEQHQELMKQVSRNEELCRALLTVANATSLTKIAHGATSGLSKSQVGCAHYASSSLGH